MRKLTLIFGMEDQRKFKIALIINDPTTGETPTGDVFAESIVSNESAINHPAEIHNAIEKAKRGLQAGDTITGVVQNGYVSTSKHRIVAIDSVSTDVANRIRKTFGISASMPAQRVTDRPAFAEN